MPQARTMAEYRWCHGVGRMTRPKPANPRWSRARGARGGARGDRRCNRVGDRRHGRLVVEGEPGCGRSALLGWANELAAARGTLTLFGRGLELEHDFSFGLVLPLFGPFIAGAGEDRAALCRVTPRRVQYWSAGEPDRVDADAAHALTYALGRLWRTSGPTPMQMRCSSRSMTCRGRSALADVPCSSGRASRGCRSPSSYRRGRATPSTRPWSNASATTPVRSCYTQPR